MPHNELTPDGKKLYEITRRLTSAWRGVGATIEEHTTTRDAELTLSQVIERVYSNPNDLDWILLEGYFDSRHNDVRQAVEFSNWRDRLQQEISNEFECIETVNRIASLIDWSKESNNE